MGLSFAGVFNMASGSVCFRTRGQMEAKDQNLLAAVLTDRRVMRASARRQNGASLDHRFRDMRGRIRRKRIGKAS